MNKVLYFISLFFLFIVYSCSTESRIIIQGKKKSYDVDELEKYIDNNQKDINITIDNIKEHLRYDGYYNAKVDTQYDRGLNYIVNLGKRYKIGRLKHEILEDDKLNKDINDYINNSPISKGSYLSEKLLKSESQNIMSYMRNVGYYDFNESLSQFIADTLAANANEIPLIYRIKNNTKDDGSEQNIDLHKYHINKVYIKIPKDFNFSIDKLRNINLIKSDSLYNENLVNETYRRFTELSIFNSVNIQFSKIDTSLLNCNIEILPSNAQGVKVDLEGTLNLNNIYGIAPGLTYYHKNLFNGGEYFNFSVNSNFQFKRAKSITKELSFSTGLSIPIFSKYKFLKDFDFSFAYNYQNRPEYTRNIISFSGGINGRYKLFNYNLYLVQLNIVKLSQINEMFQNSLKSNPFITNAFNNHFHLGTGLNIVLSNNYNLKEKKSFYYYTLQVNSAGAALSMLNPILKTNDKNERLIWGKIPYAQYLRLETSISETHFLSSSESLAYRALFGIGYAYGNSKSLPFEQHFYGGGANSLRAWQVRSVGPGIAKMDSSFVLPNQTGDIKMEANLEYRFKLKEWGPVIWEAAFFLDAGNVWTYNDKSSDIIRPGQLRFATFLESIAFNWGIGSRFKWNSLIFRIDFGFKLHDPAKAEGDRWSLGMNPGDWAAQIALGYPF